MHEIFNNIMTMTKMHQVTAFFCRFWRKCKRPKSKRKMLIVRCTRWYQLLWNLHHRTRIASPFQTWWSVRCAIPTFDVNQCSLRGSTFYFCLLRLGLVVTWGPDEHFRTRIHGVLLLSTDHSHADVQLRVFISWCCWSIFLDHADCPLETAHIFRKWHFLARFHQGAHNLV